MNPSLLFIKRLVQVKPFTRVRGGKQEAVTAYTREIPYDSVWTSAERVMGVQTVRQTARWVPRIKASMERLWKQGVTVKIHKDIDPAVVTHGLANLESAIDSMKKIAPDFNPRGLQVELRDEEARRDWKSGWLLEGQYYPADDKLYIYRYGEASPLHELMHRLDAQRAHSIGRKVTNDKMRWSSATNKDFIALMQQVKKLDSFRDWNKKNQHPIEVFARLGEQFAYNNVPAVTKEYRQYQHDLALNMGDYLYLDDYETLEPLIRKVFKR